ncbi:hypothetical protein M5K25_018879 [Dendrobium thyrsiflorum]|uniref:Uncharacterized protein n=1 Tax=Dendrobium thyrsiflorum TaxID=117978 RepID=A0ABD0UK97_DENTH
MAGILFLDFPKLYWYLEVFRLFGLTDNVVSSVASCIKCDFVGGKNGGRSTVKLQYVRKKQKEQKDVSLAAASSAPPLGRKQRFRYVILLLLVCFWSPWGLLESANDKISTR